MLLRIGSKHSRGQRPQCLISCNYPSLAVSILNLSNPSQRIKCLPFSCPTSPVHSSSVPSWDSLSLSLDSPADSSVGTKVHNSSFHSNAITYSVKNYPFHTPRSWIRNAELLGISQHSSHRKSEHLPSTIRPQGLDW